MELWATNSVELPSLWILVSRRIQSKVLEAVWKHVTISLRLGIGLQMVSIIYGATTVFDCMVFWDELRKIESTVTGLWFIICNFNACFGAQEKKRRPHLAISSHEFVVTTNDCDLSRLVVYTL